MKNEPLLNWSYTQQEWDAYVSIEKTNKKEDNIYFGIGILILGVLFLMFFRGTSFLMGLSFALPFSALVPWLRMRISYPYLKKSASDRSAKVFQKYLLINQKKIILFGDKRRVLNLQIITSKNGLLLLEFDVQWLTRKGPTSDEFRILIPATKLEEATSFVSKFGF